MRLDDYLSRSAELRSLFEAVKREFLSKRLVHHNWNHVLRDLARAITLGEAEKANTKIVLASVLLHDIGRLFPKDAEDHHLTSAKIAPRYLRETGFSKTEIKQIQHCIRSHGPRGLEEPVTLEARVCYDVDVFSCSVGYIGVGRVFDYFMREENMSVKEMIEIPSGKKGRRKSFYTKTGTRLSVRGFQKAAKFWRQLDKEFRKEQGNVREFMSEYEGD